MPVGSTGIAAQQPGPDELLATLRKFARSALKFGYGAAKNVDLIERVELQQPQLGGLPQPVIAVGCCSTCCHIERAMPVGRRRS